MRWYWWLLLASVAVINVAAILRWSSSCEADAVEIAAGSARAQACAHFRGPNDLNWLLFLPTAAAIAAAFAAALTNTTRYRSLMVLGGTAVLLGLGAFLGLLFVWFMPEVFPTH